MTKAELVKAFKEATQATTAPLTIAQAQEHLERLGDICVAELCGGGEVPLLSIGKLKVTTTAARSGRNPRTGAVIQIPAKKRVVLAVGKELKESLQ